MESHIAPYGVDKSQGNHCYVSNTISWVIAYPFQLQKRWNISWRLLHNVFTFFRLFLFHGRICIKHSGVDLPGNDTCTDITLTQTNLQNPSIRKPIILIMHDWLKAIQKTHTCSKIKTIFSVFAFAPKVPTCISNRHRNVGQGKTNYKISENRSQLLVTHISCIKSVMLEDPVFPLFLQVSWTIMLSQFQNITTLRNELQKSWN